MRGVLALTVGIGLAACGAGVGETGAPDANGADASDVDDAPVDTTVPLGPWGPPVPVEIAPVGDDDPSATGDLLELYFNRAQDILVTTRASVTDAWSTPVVVSELSSTENDTTPEISYDGLTIHLASTRPGGSGRNDVYVATRTSRGSAWSTPVRVVELASTATESSATTDDQLVMVLESDRAGSNDVYLAQRASTVEPWSTPAPIDIVNTPDVSDGNPMLSADGLELYFDTARTGDSELHIARRDRVDLPFSAPQRIDELASPTSDETDAWISADGRTLMFTSNRDGTSRLWKSTR